MLKRIIKLINLTIFIIVLFVILVACTDESNLPIEGDDGKDPRGEPGEIPEPLTPDKEADKFFDIPYGEHPSQRIDIYLPKKLGAIIQPIPAFVILHDDFFVLEDKSEMGVFVGTALSYGFAAIAVNYRTYADGATYLDMLDDIDALVRFLKEYANGYMIKNDKIAFMGSSVGGYLAMLYSYRNKPPIKVALIGSMSAMTDFTDAEFYASNEMFTMEEKIEYVSRLTGAEFTVEDVAAGRFPEALRDASPLYHINGDMPFTLLLHGYLDKAVPFSNFISLSNAVQGIDKNLSDFVIFMNSGHDLTNDDAKYNEGMAKLVLAVLKYYF